MKSVCSEGADLTGNSMLVLPCISAWDVEVDRSLFKMLRLAATPPVWAGLVASGNGLVGAGSSFVVLQLTRCCCLP
jgi:hypothetical protein